MRVGLHQLRGPAELRHCGPRLCLHLLIAASCCGAIYVRRQHFSHEALQSAWSALLIQIGSSRPPEQPLASASENVA